MRSIFILFFFALISNCSFSQTSRIDDSLALVDLYNSTNGVNWTSSDNWLTGNPINTWWGVYTNSDNRVNQIILGYNNLSGTLPSSIGNLTYLTNLDLHNGSLSGTLPASIGHLGSLESLDIGYNQFTGSLPSEIGSLTSLTYLYLSNNTFSGALPGTIGNLKSLRYLLVEFTDLSDTLPASIGNLTSLITLELSHNRFSGSIPATLGNLKNATAVYLERNQFTGSIPAALGGMTSVFDLRMHTNHLTGTIPKEIFQMPSLKTFFVYRNQLSGPLPQFPNDSMPVFNLDISENNFVFDGTLEKIAAKPGYTIYAPQATVPLRTGNAMTFTVSSATQSFAGDTSLQHDSIYWFKNKILDHVTVGDTTTVFAQINIGDSVFAVTRNAYAPALTLYSDTTVYTGALPVTLTSFSAAPKGNNVIVSWQTMSETNLSDFSIQRSIDGIHFTTLGHVRPSGNQGTVHYYSYNDINVVNLLGGKQIYYRLQMDGEDGTTNYTEIRLVQLPGKHLLFAVSPNPANSNVHITSNCTMANVLINVRSINGAVLFSIKHNFITGEQFSIPVTKFARQTLFLTISAEDYNQKITLIKD